MEIVWRHENVDKGDTEYDMRDTWTVTNNGVTATATVITPFDVIGYRSHDWRIRKAVITLAKRLKVSKKTLRKPLLSAMRSNMNYWPSGIWMGFLFT